MIAGIASRHMYSMASWSPSQSDPFTVSYMCQRQSSSPMLPSAAPMPPWAATVWLRVGKTLVMQAVLRPGRAHAEGGAQPGAAGADHHHVIGVVDDAVGAAGGLMAFIAFIGPVDPLMRASDRDPQDRERRGDAPAANRWP